MPSAASVRSTVQSTSAAASGRFPRIWALTAPVRSSGAGGLAVSLTVRRSAAPSPAYRASPTSCGTSESVAVAQPSASSIAARSSSLLIALFAGVTPSCWA
jgi:hypothetical protein